MWAWKGKGNGRGPLESVKVIRGRGQLGRRHGSRTICAGKIDGRGPVNVMIKALVNRSTSTFSRSDLPHKYIN